jgi:hypothetical protein
MDIVFKFIVMDSLLNAFFGQVLLWLRLPGKNPVLCYAFEMEKITYNLGRSVRR